MKPSTAAFLLALLLFVIYWLSRFGLIESMGDSWAIVYLEMAAVLTGFVCRAIEARR